MGPSKKKAIPAERISHELFEPDPCRKEEEKEFYKSTQNFYKNEENNSEENLSNLINPNSNNGDFTEFKNFNNFSNSAANNNIINSTI